MNSNVPATKPTNFKNFYQESFLSVLAKQESTHHLKVTRIITTYNSPGRRLLKVLLRLYRKKTRS